ncbi:hypothetical protein D6C85_06363 [Aureobasidium pullulans]|uniref:Uncharacterized protein n=1 Tax=Aureobasidium pullulans TaxID=5580 RepID=A0A4S9WUX4_AURPU|nr:hypothetical protein D6C85_06363 [Aureobasidium pullulans]
MASLWQKAQQQLSDADQQLFDFNRPESERRLILEDILRSVQVQNERCLNKRWKIKGTGGREIILRDVCGKLLSWVDQFLSVVDVIVQYDPVHSSLPWAGIRLFLQISLNDVKTFEAMIEGLEITARVVAQYSLVEILYLKGHTEAKKQLQGQVTILYAAVLRYLCRARKYYSHNTATRTFVNAFRPPELDDALKQITDQEALVCRQADLVDTERQMSLAALVSDIEAAGTITNDGLKSVQRKLDRFGVSFLQTTGQVSALHHDLDRKQKIQILSWLSCVPYRQHYEALSSDIMPNSGQWLALNSKYIDWYQSNSSQMLRLIGSPGCGKTKLISATLQCLRSEVETNPTAAPIAFFYCSKNPGELERADPCQILRALAKQIALSEDQTGILAPVISIHKNKRIQAEQDGLSPPSLNLSECKKLILELTAMTPATIIIDAIDECNSVTRHQLLTALEEILGHSHKPVKILVSSQKARDIDVRLDKFACITVNEKQNKNDIDAFVDLQVATAIESKQMLAGRVSLDFSNRVASILKTKAEGSFRWVALQLQRLCDPDTVKLERDVHDVLLRPPQTLLAFYDSIHQRILAMEKQSQSIAFATFYWLLHAKQLLSVDALLSAVSMSLIGDDKSLAIGDILDCCCNLVEIDEVLNVIRLSHSTVQDYLESLGHFAPQQAHANLARSCLEILIHASGNSMSRIYQYAVVYWAAHYEIAQSQEKADADLLSTFLFEDDHLEKWLEALSSILPTRQTNLVGELSQKLHAVWSVPESPLFAISCFGLHPVLDFNQNSDQILDWHQPNSDGASALSLASHFGHLETVRYLLQQDLIAGSARHISPSMDKQQIDFRNRSAFGSRPQSFANAIQAAVARSHESIAKLIIEYGFCFPDQESFDRCFRRAIFSGQLAVVELLIGRFAGMFTPRRVQDQLQVALFGGKERQAKALFVRYGDINQQTGFFGNALQAAVCGGKLSLVKALADREARFEVRGLYGYPLRAAVVLGHESMVRWLLEEAKADPNIEDIELGDCLQAAAFKGHLGIINLLLQHEANLEGLGGPFWTPLSAAYSAGQMGAVRLLLNHVASVNTNSRSRSGNALLSPSQILKEQSIRLPLQRVVMLTAELTPEAGLANKSCNEAFGVYTIEKLGDWSLQLETRATRKRITWKLRAENRRNLLESIRTVVSVLLKNPRIRQHLLPKLAADEQLHAVMTELWIDRIFDFGGRKLITESRTIVEAAVSER